MAESKCLAALGIAPEINNLLFLGGAGSGKSEISVNLATRLASEGDRAVHFFDLDMTKPLFRSRDAAGYLEQAGVNVHFQEQFMDAPTLVGGVVPMLRDKSCLTILDVGGDHIGARSVGGFAPQLNGPDTAVLYVINSYRPWSDTIEHIDETLGRILGVSHVKLERLMLVANPNNGLNTSLDEVLEGFDKIRDIVGPYLPVSFVCVREELSPQAEEKLPVPVFPLRLSLIYPWLV